MWLIIFIIALMLLNCYWWMMIKFFLCSFWNWGRVFFFILCLVRPSWSVMWPCGHVRSILDVGPNRIWPGLGQKILVRQLFRTWPEHIGGPVMSVICAALVIRSCLLLLDMIKWCLILSCKLPILPSPQISKLKLQTLPLLYLWLYPLHIVSLTHT